MSKKLNHSLAIGIFLIGLFSTNVSLAQTYTNVYWYPSSALGGTGSWSASGSLWSTNSSGGGTLSNPTALGTNIIYNFSGTAGTVSSPSSITVGGINWLTTGYTFQATTTSKTYTGTDATATGTNTISIANNANLNITGAGFVFDALSMTGGSGSRVTLTNAAAATTTIIFGSTQAKGGRTNSVNTIIDGAGTIILGSQSANSGFTQAGNIVNNSTGTFVLTNSASGTVTVSGVISGSGGLQVKNTSSGKIVLSGLDNSFSGGVTLAGPSTLHFNKFGMSGLNSSLGTSGTISVGLAGQNSGNGTLRWTGSADETSDKVINLNSSTNGVNIYANGATNATLRLDGAIVSVASGSKSFNFQGAATNTLILNGLINENGGINSVGIGGFSSGTVVLGNANNSFSGAITITNGTASQNTYLQTTNIGNANANSTLGRNGTINFSSSDATAGTALKYTGTGETSDKVINLAGTLGGATLDQSGTGNLKFTSAMTATGVGAKAITLQGSTAGTGEIAAAISNLGGNTISLNKKGTGAWTLSGDNSYTGVTTVSAGTLTLSGNNSAASGGVTLTGGTLNIKNSNALGTGLFSFGGATIDNTSGSALVLAGNQASMWNSTNATTFGSSTNTAANNLNLGTGTVTLSGSRTVNLLGTETKLTMADVIGTSGTRITANGTGNTLEMKSLSLSTSATPMTMSLEGTANIVVTGAIVNGTTPGNGLTVAATGTTTLSGDNTYTGVTKMSGAGGTLNLRGNNSSATGGTTLEAGTLNINNVNALSTGLLELSAVTGTAYGSSIINNTSGGALAFSGLSGVKWSGTSPAGIQFGTSASTSANNMDFGTGLVTASTSRSMNIAGTGVTIFMGTLTASGTAASYDYTIDGAGNTLDLDGWKLSGATTPTQAQLHKLKGSANVNIGAIENGTGSFANGVSFQSDGVTRLTGNNTYTGATEFVGSGTNIISGNNSAAVGNVTIAGISGSGKLPVVRLDNINAISSSSSLLGSSGSAQIGTLDLRAAGNFSLNSFGTVSKEGNNMIFMNSSGSQKTLAFTAADNYITAADSGGKTLYNNSANLLLDFDGNIEIGGDSSGGEATTLAGVGNFNVDGNLLDTGNGLTRTLRKQGAGTLTLQGSANNIRGSTLVETGTLDLYGNLTASTDIVVSTSGTSTTGARTVNSTVNVRTGGSLLNSSTTTVWSRGNLIVNGTAGDVVVKNYGLLGGSGTVDAITLESGSFLTPGNSPGTLNATSASLLAGSTYNWEINNAAVTPGAAGRNWDLLNVTNELNLSTLTTLSGGQLNLVLKSLDFAGLGTTSLSGFTIDTAYSWVFAQAGSINNANFTLGADVTDYFNINTTAFNNDALPAGYFKVQVGETITEGGSTLKTLQLMTIPEPSTGSMLGLGFAGLVVSRLLRRKNS
jgi:autotransporter-associated beta strand protein